MSAVTAARAAAICREIGFREDEDEKIEGTITEQKES